MKILGKSNFLTFISNKFSYIPIPEFEKMPKYHFFPVFAAKKLAKKLGYPVIIRSDGPEDRLGLSYAGLFDSIVVNSLDDWELTVNPFLERKKNSKLLKVQRGYNKKQIKEYCKIREVKQFNGNIDIIIQKYIKTDVSLTITSHPHQRNKYFIDINKNKNIHSPTEYAGFIVSCDRSKLIINNQLASFLKTCPSGLTNELQMAVTYFQEIEKELDIDISYQAEFILNPLFLVQFRPFRKKNFADFKIEKLNIPSDDNTIRIPIVFGITTEEGLSLKHYSDFSSYFELINKCIKNIHDIEEPKHFIKQSVEKLYINYDPQKIIASLPELKYFQIELENKRVLPMVSIFNINRDYYAWQNHDCFRLLERGSIVGLSLNSPFKSFHHANAKFWSDGEEGIIRFK